MAVGVVWTPSAAADVPSGGCTQASGQTTCTFAFTGAAESFKVPAGVTSATFDLYGAQGGQLTYIGAPQQAEGAHLHAVLAVTPGETLTVTVGGKGVDDRTCGPAGTGGFNGGGQAGAGGFHEDAGRDCNRTGSNGGGGGGGTDVRSEGTGLADRVLVAGGGGGGGGVGTGGGEGGDSGAAGAIGDSNLTAASGQPGGAGEGGSGGVGAVSTDIGCALPGSGAAGTFGAGGSGGSLTSQDGRSGGGGGGGWYGGGGGAAGDEFCRQSGSGGGGGSSHAAAQATGVMIVQGQRVGHGLLTMTFAIPAAPVTTIDVSGTAGDDGWLRSPAQVTVTSLTATTFRCSVDQSPAPATFDDLPDSCPASLATTSIAGDGTHLVAASSRDDVGTTDVVRTATIKIDATPPEVTCPSAAEFGQNAAGGGQITATVVDATSGARAAVATATLTASDLATPGVRTKSVTGGDVAGNTTSVNCSFTVVAPPVIAITSPTDRASFTQNQVVRAAYACTVASGTVTACAGPVASGAPIDTSRLGRHTFSVTAKGSHGTSTTRTVTYTVLPPPVLCRGLKATLLNVDLRGRRVTVDGITLSTNAGKSVAIHQNGRPAGSAKVRPDGTFSATVRAPRGSASRASYTATVAGVRTSAMRLKRLLTITSSRGLTHRFRLSLPKAKLPRKVDIRRQVTCGTRTRAGSVRVSRNGTFSARFARPAAGEVAIYRVVAPLRGGAAYSVFVAVRR